MAVATIAASAISEQGEVIWLFTATGFSFLGLVGYSLLEVGVSRIHNSPILLFKNLVQFAIGLSIFWLVGYAFAFGDVDKQFIGKDMWAVNDVGGTSHHVRMILYCIIGMYAVFTINSCIMERAQLYVHLWVSLVVMSWVYPTIVAWIWGGGWLIDIEEKAVDAGGAGPIHILGGTIGLIGTMFLRPRLGLFDQNEPLVFVRNRCIKVKVGPENFTWAAPMIATMGGVLLWLGLCFVNAATGSDLIDAAQGFLNSLVAGSSSCIISVILRTIGDRSLITHFSALIFGMIAGVVSVSASCQNIEPWGAFIIGIIGGILYSLMSWIFRRVNIDDPLEAVSSQLVCGVWSLLAVGFFDDNEGVFQNGDGTLLGIQLLAIISILGWSGFFGLVIFGPIALAEALRVSQEVELLGLINSKIAFGGFSLAQNRHIKNWEIETEDLSDDDESDEDE